MTEAWRPVVGFEGAYEVSDLGRVRSLGRTVFSRTRRGDPLPRFQVERILKQNKHAHGYRLVHLHWDGRRKAETVHALVAAAFLGPRPAEREVAHKDGQRANNVLRNLRYDTTAGNHADKVAHGTDNRGVKHPLAVLDEVAVRAIRAARDTHESIAAQFGISRSQVSRIRRREAWRHV